MKTNKTLKRRLVLQSFSPLFLLIAIQHVGHFELVGRLFADFQTHGIQVWHKVISHPALGDFIVSFASIVWLLFTIGITIGYRQWERYGSDSKGEKIHCISEEKDSGITFLVSFVLPLLVDDVETLRGFVLFSVMLTLVIVLLMKSNLFYQNPVLVALGYKTYAFKFANVADNGLDTNREYIGIGKVVPPDGATIRRKYISDGVFIIVEE